MTDFNLDAFIAELNEGIEDMGGPCGCPKQVSCECRREYERYVESILFEDRTYILAMARELQQARKALEAADQLWNTAQAEAMNGSNPMLMKDADNYSDARAAMKETQQ